MSVGIDIDRFRRAAVYFSREITKSGAQSRARLISESGKVKVDLRADSAYWAARSWASSIEPYRYRISRICPCVTPLKARSRSTVSMTECSAGVQRSRE